MINHKNPLHHEISRPRMKGIFHLDDIIRYQGKNHQMMVIQMGSSFLSLASRILLMS